MSVTLIVGRFFSSCSACNGNADPDERRHIRGGPGGGYRKGSALSDMNGCGATFTERYFVYEGRTEPIVIIECQLPIGEEWCALPIGHDGDCAEIIEKSDKEL